LCLTGGVSPLAFGFLLHPNIEKARTTINRTNILFLTHIVIILFVDSHQIEETHNSDTYSKDFPQGHHPII
jgi:hypothetical protein